MGLGKSVGHKDIPIEVWKLLGEKENCLAN